MDLNKVMLIGRCAQDPEVRTTPSGAPVTSFSLATGFVWTDQQGQKQERTEWHNIVAWRKLAEICGQYLRKGSKIYIEGRLETRSWDDQSGVKKYKTEVIADNMIMLDRKPDGAGSSASSSAGSYREQQPKYAAAEPAESAGRPQSSEEEISVEDIPF